MENEITQAIAAAVDKNYFEFVKNIEVVVQQKVDNHPGVQAYRDDLKYYKDFTSGLPSINEPEPKPKDEPEKKDEL